MRCFLRREEVSVRADSPARRLWRWSTRHPGTSTAIVLSLILLFATIAITSLSAVVFNQRHAAVHERSMTELVTRVARQSHDIDNELMRYLGLLDGLAVLATELHQRGMPSQARLYTEAHLAKGDTPADWGHLDRYGTHVSFEDLVYIAAPGVDLASTDDENRRLLPMRDRFRETMLRSVNEEAVTWSHDEQIQALREAGAPPSWLYIGLASGVLINYPGYSIGLPDYDPRIRPWYLYVVDAHGPRWGAPYAEASGQGILLPCNRALYNDDGNFFGVMGLDVELDTVIEMLQPDTDQDVIGAWLVDSQGIVIVDSQHKGVKLGRGVDLRIDQQPFPVAEVRAGIDAEKGADHIDLGDSIIVYHRMAAAGLYYVVEVTTLRGRQP